MLGGAGEEHQQHSNNLLTNNRHELVGQQLLLGSYMTHFLSH